MQEITRIAIVVAILILVFGNRGRAQSGVVSKEKMRRWQHLDLAQDSVYGMSMDRTYKEVLKGRPHSKIIVAIIDSGIDLLHPDLAPVLWRNAKEMGRDEDRNGYINDGLGWNFLGLKPGNKNLKPGMEHQRVYLTLKDVCSKFSETEIRRSKNSECLAWLSTRKAFKEDSISMFSQFYPYWNNIIREDSIWRQRIGKAVYTYADLVNFENHFESKNNEMIPLFLKADSTRTNETILSDIDKSKSRLVKEFSLGISSRRLETTGDTYCDIRDRFYGNANVISGDDHGTQVSLAVAAVRDNGIGIDGIADNVQIMTLKTVPPRSDEYDKDVALAIRYAVDNGAKVINMSFGKQYSPQRRWVEDAIRYAARKDVLLVHAAGNDANNTDSVTFFPSSRYCSGKRISNMITVGASGPSFGNLVASFSNYGKNTVDVFAPGYKIESSERNEMGLVPRPTSGTSIAAPMVSGLAAVLKSYFPTLSAKEIKHIIECSVTKITMPVESPDKKKVLMSELCGSGGIANGYSAAKMALKLIEK